MNRAEARKISRDDRRESGGVQSQHPSGPRSYRRQLLGMINRDHGQLARRENDGTIILVAIPRAPKRVTGGRTR